jgi:hypothetical protein
MAGLDHPGATLAQGRELALEPGVDDADECADDEDAEEGDRQHPDEEAERAGVAAHRARIERAHEAVPEQVGQPRVRAGEAEDPDHERDGDDAERRHDEQPGDERDRPSGHEVVEGVAKSFPA